MTVDLAALAKLAAKATPGPWGLFWDDYEKGDWCVIPTTNGFITEGTPVVASGIGEPDAVYIAAADPQTIAELIHEVERGRRLQSAHHRMLRVTSVTCEACKKERAK